MKLMMTALVSLFAVAAMANEPATATKTTTTTTAAPATTTATADAKKACEGKTGAELKKCETEAKKAHK